MADAQALRLKAQARLRLKEKQAKEAPADQPPPSEGMDLFGEGLPRVPTFEVTDESGLGETALKASANLIPSLANMNIDAFNAIFANPTETLGGLGTLAKGADDLVMMRDTPEQDAVQELGARAWEGVTNPINTFANDPAGVLSLLVGGTGRIPKLGREATNITKILEDARATSDAAFKRTNALPEMPFADVRAATTDAAKGAGYQQRFRDDINYPGLTELMRSKEPTETPQSVRRWRQEIERTDEGLKKKDSGLLEKSKDAFDAKIAEVNPELASHLGMENKLFGTYRTTEGLARMLESGQLRGAVKHGESATEVKRNITRVLTNARAKKGYGEVEDQLKDIVTKSPDSQGIMRTILAQSGAGATVGGLIGTKIFPGVGTAIGAMAGGSVPPIMRVARNARANAAITREMTDLIREINDLPPAKRALRIQKLDKKTRAALVAYGLLGEEESD